MNKKLSQFALPALLCAFVGVAQAAPQTITFTGDGSSFFTANAWDVSYIDSSDPANAYGGFKSVADATSSQWIATSRFDASPALFSSTTGMLFDLNGLWLAGAWGSQTLTITGFDASGNGIYTTQIGVTTTAQLYSFDWAGIASFDIATGADFVKDPMSPQSGLNWALGSVTVTPVPEPEAYAMMLAGLGIVGAIARRRRRS
jgi:hypothetical protein